MKKFVKGSLAIVGLMSLGITTASAKTMTAADIDKLTASEFGGTTIYDTAYVFGKHVYVNMFTMADSVSAANTLEGATDAKLYYKDGDNVWKNAITNDVVDKANLKVEMVKLVGNKNGNHVSTSDIYNAENGYVTTENMPDGRVGEIFTDEQSTTKIASVEVIGETNLGTDLKTDSNKYNASHTKASYNGTSIAITADAPLLDYTGDITGKLVGLKVKFNKEVNLNNVVATLAAADVKMTLDDTKTVVTVWLDASAIGTTDTIKVTDSETGETQTVALTFKEPKMASKVQSDKTYTVETEGVSATQAKIIDKLYTIFYGDDTNTTNAIVREDGDKKQITLTNNGSTIADSTVKEMIEVKTPTVAEAASGASDEVKFNQSAISNIAMTYDEKAKEYVVKLTRVANLDGAKKVNVTMDLGVVTGLAVPNGDTQDSGKTTVNHAVTYHTDEETDTNNVVTYTSSATNDSAKFRFVFVDAVPAFEVKSAKMSNVVDVYTMVSGESLTENQNKENAAYKNNTNILAFEKLELDKDSKEYNVSLQATDSTFVPDNSNNKYFGLVVDLGVDPKDITVTGGVAITENVSRFGATGTGFVVKLDVPADSASDDIIPVTFTNKKTNAVTTMNVEISKVAFVKVAEADLAAKIVYPTDGVIIVDRKEDDGSTAKYFRFNKGITEFRATVDGVEKTYTVTNNANKLATGYSAGATSVVIKGVEKTTDATNTSEYNQSAVNAVSFDSVTNTIDVKLDATLDTGKGYNIVVDLGVNTVADITGVLTNIPDSTDATKKTTKYYLTVPAASAVDKGEYEVATTPNKITVKTTYVKNSAKTYLNLNSTKEISLSGVNIPDAVKANNNGVKAAIGTLSNADKTNGVIITIDRPITKIDQNVTDYTIANQKVVGLLLDLGTRNISTTATGVTITTDSDLLTKYGATGTQVIVWVTADDKTNKTPFEVTFKNETTTNTNETYKVGFEFKEDIADLEVKAVSATTAKDNTVVSNNETYKKVQNNFTTKYETVANTNSKITITPVKNQTTVTDTFTVVDNGTSSKWYGVLVDLGIDTKYVTLSATGVTTSLDLDNAHAKDLGATSNTAFVVWVDADAIANGSFTFTNTYNDKTVTIDLVKGTLN